jgi:hypothetical protein
VAIIKSKCVQRWFCKPVNKHLYEKINRNKRLKTLAGPYREFELCFMEAGIIIRTCVSCGKQLRGRIDKKFCDDYCRNNYNNIQKAENNDYIRKVNNALRKNRKILRDLLAGKEKVARVKREQLLIDGFHFKYHTHSYTNKKGHTYLFCYEYGLLSLENECYQVVEMKEIR